MNLHKRIALSLALGTLIAFAAGASAATLTRATFTLPAQAYWNDTLLQPGEYTLSLSGTISGVPIIRLSGEGVSTAFFATTSSGDESGRSVLKLDEVDGTYVVREFDAAPAGRSYRFPVSKAVHSLTAGSVNQGITVPVSGL